MTVRLNPYLHFQTGARQAMEHYRAVLGGQLEVMTFGEQGLEGPGAEGVMHAMLTTDDGFVLMASDHPPGETLSPGDATVTLALNGDEGEKLRGWFDALAEGGEVHVPLAQQVWGDEFGQLQDRYGVQWLVNIAGPA